MGAATQLIVTLHDSNVMNLNLLRQDEIWFVERQENYSSEIYSLNKFKERFDHSVAKDYLLGRYGSVPNFGIDPWEEGGIKWQMRLDLRHQPCFHEWMMK